MLGLDKGADSDSVFFLFSGKQPVQQKHASASLAFLSRIKEPAHGSEGQYYSFPAMPMTG